MADPGTSLPVVHTQDGVALAVQVRGPADAPTALVLAHGFSMSSTDRRLAALAGGLAQAGHAVYTFDFRGHGRSGGICTLGELEVLDLDAVIRLARAHGHGRVMVIGASMGGFVALRHAALLGGQDAVAAISTPATWGVSPRLRARGLLWAVRSRSGRRILSAMGTRVVDRVAVPPLSPSELAHRITIPVTLIHGARDPYVPTDDALLLHAGLAGPRNLVILPSFGHAEAAYSPEFVSVLRAVLDELITSPRRGPSDRLVEPEPELGQGGQASLEFDRIIGVALADP